MDFSIDEAYAAVGKSCLVYEADYGEPKYEVVMAIAADSVEEYVLCVQFVVGAFKCLDVTTFKSYVDGELCIEFISTHRPELGHFRVRFPIAERCEIGGKFKIGGLKPYDDASSFVYGIKRTYWGLLFDERTEFMKVGE